MNTKAVKSFGLALMLAAGVLAVLLALGTFSPQKAGAQATAIADVAISPATLPGGTASFFNVGFSATGTIYGGEEIVVGMAGFVLPDSIAASNINLRTGTGGDTQRGNPANVAVDTDKGTITLTLPTDMDITGASSITFLRGAGIKAPLYADAVADVTGEADTIGDQAYNVSVSYGTVTGNTATDFDVNRSVSIKPASGNSDSTITVTGSGFADGDVRIYVNQTADSPTTDTTSDPPVPLATELAKTVKSAKGAFTASIPVTNADESSLFENGANYLHVYGIAADVSRVDGDGDTGGVQGHLFTLNGKVDVASKLVRGTTGVEVELTEAPASAVGTLVCITGVSLGEDDPAAVEGENAADLNNDNTDEECGTGEVIVDTEGAATFTFTVPSGATVGEEVSLVVNGTSGGTAVEGGLGSATVEVASIPLTLSPSEAVQGTSVTLTATGFTKSGDNAEVMTLEIKEAGEESVFVDHTEALGVGDIDAVNGQYAFSFTVPDLAKGEATVRLTDEGGRVGEGKLTISAPTVGLEPGESRRGTSVIVTGTGFPANDQVVVTYGQTKDAVSANVGEIVGRAATDASGAFSTVITVPSHAVDTSAGKNYVQAFRPQLGTNGNRASNSAEHAVPAPSTDVSPTEGRVGATITVSGEAHPANAAIVINIDGDQVNEKGDTADGNGDFSIDVQIPKLEQRFVALTGTVGGANITPVLIEILPEPEVPAVRDVATEFADLIEADVLESVFRYNKATKDWSGYNPDAPAAANDLDVINSGDFLFIAVSADADYAGETLTPTWNLVVAP